MSGNPRDAALRRSSKAVAVIEKKGFSVRAEGFSLSLEGRAHDRTEVI